MHPMLVIIDTWLAICAGVVLDDDICSPRATVDPVGETLDRAKKETFEVNMTVAYKTEYLLSLRNSLRLNSHIEQIDPILFALSPPDPTSISSALSCR